MAPLLGGGFLGVQPADYRREACHVGMVQVLLESGWGAQDDPEKGTLAWGPARRPCRSEGRTPGTGREGISLTARQSQTLSISFLH